MPAELPAWMTVQYTPPTFDWRTYEDHLAGAQPGLAPCPVCRAACVVRETTVQATRTVPMHSIGQQAYCSPCDVFFKIGA